MTGIVAERASSSTVACEKVRAASTSTYWLKTRAKSTTLSRTPRPTSLPCRKMAFPPRRAIAASKLTRVRSDGFSNSRPKVAARQDRRAPARLLVALDLDRLIDQPASLGRRDFQEIQKMTWHARGPFQTTACRNTSARMAQPSSIWSSVIVKAGNSRTTWPCVALIKSRRRMHSATIVRGIDGQIQPDHGALDPDVAHQLGQLGADRLEMVAKPFADGDSALEQAVGLDGLDGRQGRPAGDRVAAEGRGVHPRLEHRGDRRPGHHHAGRDARRPGPWRRSGCRARPLRAGRQTIRRSGPCRSGPRRESRARRARRTTCRNPAR